MRVSTGTLDSPTNFMPEGQSCPTQAILTSTPNQNGAPFEANQNYSLMQPNQHSSIHGTSHSTLDSNNSQTRPPIPPKQNNWRTIIINANSIAGKAAELSHLVSYTKPDAVIMTETKLGKNHKNSEFMPKGYTVHRKDRKAGGGGVLVAIRDIFPSIAIEQVNITGEVVWVEISLRDKNKLLVGSFYRQPTNKTDQLEQLELSLQQLSRAYSRRSNHAIILGGDFNAGDII